MGKGGSKKGEHRGNARKRDERDVTTPKAVMDRAVRPAAPGSRPPTAPQVENDLLAAQIIHGIQSADDMSPKQVMLANMRHFQNAAFLTEAMLMHVARQPDTEETRTAARVYEQESERLRRIASDEAYKVAPFIHPRLAAIAAVGGGEETDIVQAMFDEIDRRNREHPPMLDVTPQKREA